MFFPERIRNIKPEHLVLEVGPGGTPHPRSDVLLEKKFPEKEAVGQRGNAPPLKTDKKVVYYEGGAFPFKELEFDYVICSHVLEHLDSEELEDFIKELQRVAPQGYIEFPLIYYDYLFDIPQHMTLLFFNGVEIVYLPKSKARIEDYKPITGLFRSALERGYRFPIEELKEIFFQGFEWTKPIVMRRAESVDELLFSEKISLPWLHIRDEGTSGNKLTRFIARIRRTLNFT